MKVYYLADDSSHGWMERIEAYLDGDYPAEEGYELLVHEAPSNTARIWASMESIGVMVERVYEIDLPHSEAELAAYKDGHEPGCWTLPWYIVAGHPVKIMEARIEHRIMGVPKDGSAPRGVSAWDER